MRLVLWLDKMGKIWDFITEKDRIEREELAEEVAEVLYKKLGKHISELNPVCEVCGNKRPIKKIIGKCVKCGKVVCKSWSTNCGQKILLSFQPNFPAGVYCKDCINK